ncbi:MAG: response regulator [Candidatus Falkowbacteria bacterium]|nr:response regulator [Candidatus Falkowbacteria bacterium]
MKILIVDNDTSTVTTLKALLLSQEVPFEIDTAYGGQEGLDKMVAHPDYDLVLLDIMMPTISGMDVCQQMMKDYRLREIPVLLMSSSLPIPPGEFQESLQKFSPLSVVKGVIEKPFVIGDLLAEINKVARRPL